MIIAKTELYKESIALIYMLIYEQSRYPVEVKVYIKVYG